MKNLLGALLLLFISTPVHADIHEGEFDIQGWCITGPDNRIGVDPAFNYAVTGKVNPQALAMYTQGREHVHLDDLVKDGYIPNIEATYGHSYIFSGYWVKEHGQDHFRAYVPKSDPGLEEVPCEVALAVNSNTKDQYLPEGVDTEMLRQKGLGADGQTN